LLVEGAFLCFSQNSFQKQDCLTKKPLLIGKRKKEKKKKKKKEGNLGKYILSCIACESIKKSKELRRRLTRLDKSNIFLKNII
jgi:hypothetical protein